MGTLCQRRPRRTHWFRWEDDLRRYAERAPGTAGRQKHETEKVGNGMLGDSLPLLGGRAGKPQGKSEQSISLVISVVI